MPSWNRDCKNKDVQPTHAKDEQDRQPRVNCGAPTVMRRPEGRRAAGFGLRGVVAQLDLRMSLAVLRRLQSESAVPLAFNLDGMRGETVRAIRCRWRSLRAHRPITNKLKKNNNKWKKSYNIMEKLYVKYFHNENIKILQTLFKTKHEIGQKYKV